MMTLGTVLWLTYVISTLASDSAKKKLEGYPKVTYPTCEVTATDPDADCIFGEAGKDYPVFASIPNTEFPCQDHLPGIYAEPKAYCQVYHMCLHDGSRYSFLCPNGTLFNQAYFVCDLWYNVECSRATDFYQLNENIYKDPEPVDDTKWDTNDK